MTAKRKDTTTLPVDDVDRPMTDDEFGRGRTAFVAKRARDATNLSQAEFSSRYGIPIGTVRDWEQGRKAAEAAAMNYLLVITKMPDAVAEALTPAA
jgi:putative transcriptional regulator